MSCGRCGNSVSLAEDTSAYAAPQHPAEIGLNLAANSNSDATRSARSQPLLDIEELPQLSEDWNLDQHLESLQARVEPYKIRRRARPIVAAPNRAPRYRTDVAHLPVARPHKPPSRMTGDRGVGSSAAFTLAIVWFGFLTFLGGTAFLGWSILAERVEPWNLGLPLACGGAIILVLGVMLQLERIWKNSRYAVRKLKQLDAQLQELERVTTLLGVTHGSASQAYYAHMAEQANPHILLADLKGQIDLLARSMSRH